MISVIIPVYNGEATIGALLDSLLSNKYEDSEIIVVDDGSTDGTSEIASAYPVKLESTGGRRGPAVARNIGARKSAGEILLFLDSDTLVKTDILSHIAGRFAAEPELVAIVGYYDGQPLNIGFFPRYKALLVHYWFRNALVMESFETCCGAIRKSVFEITGGFDETYSGADVEDYEFGYRVMEQGPVLVDHKMIIGHHFPSFADNFSNYFKRSRLWMKLFLERRRFESTATTGGEGVARLLGFGAAFFMVAGIVWGPLFFMGLILFLAYVIILRSEERRGGKEWRSRWSPDH